MPECIKASVYLISPFFTCPVSSIHIIFGHRLPSTSTTLNSHQNYALSMSSPETTSSIPVNALPNAVAGSTAEALNTRPPNNEVPSASAPPPTKTSQEEPELTKGELVHSPVPALGADFETHFPVGSIKPQSPLLEWIVPFLVRPLCHVFTAIIYLRKALSTKVAVGWLLAVAVVGLLLGHTGVAYAIFSTLFQQLANFLGQVSQAQWWAAICILYAIPVQV